MNQNTNTPPSVYVALITVPISFLILLGSLFEFFANRFPPMVIVAVVLSVLAAFASIMMTMRKKWALVLFSLIVGIYLAYTLYGMYPFDNVGVFPFIILTLIFLLLGMLWTKDRKYFN